MRQRKLFLEIVYFASCGFLFSTLYHDTELSLVLAYLLKMLIRMIARNSDCWLESILGLISFCLKISSLVDVIWWDGQKRKRNFIPAWSLTRNERMLGIILHISNVCLTLSNITFGSFKIFFFMNLEKTGLFQGSYFGKIMNNMKLSSRSQFPWNTIFGPLALMIH